MSKIITSEVVVAYSQCLAKAFLLLFTEEKGNPVEYLATLDQSKQSRKDKYFQKNNLASTAYSICEATDMRHGVDRLVNVRLRLADFEASCDVLTKVDKELTSRKANYAPAIFIGTRSISREHRLELAFIGYILSKLQGSCPAQGTIINAGGVVHKVKLTSLQKSVQKIISSLQDWLITPPGKSPPIILNKHCPYCQYQEPCRLKAEQEDNLSLLSGMAAKAIRHYEKKGIFTVKQLSYLFKPKRLRKQARSRYKTHKPELQALAIRTGKIYIQELPQLSRQTIELFIDFEGIPDQQSYYLFGALVCEENKSTQYSYWADTDQEEARSWRSFVDMVNEYTTAPVYHYGSYELKALDVLSKRYGIDAEAIRSRLVNINTCIYGKIYFPLTSNGLKEIGGFIGATWVSPKASGLQSLVWRYHWETTRDVQYKDLLLTYNRDDCVALKRLADEISNIKDSANILSTIDFVSEPKRHATEAGKQVHNQFESILRFAHANYDQKKIKFRQSDEENPAVIDKPTVGRKLGYQGQRKIRPKPSKVVEVPPGEVCPKDGESLRPTEQIARRLIVDLVLTKDGIKKTITEYIGKQGYCPKCGRVHSPPGIREYGPTQLYGHGFQVWVVYQRVALRMTYAHIAETLAEQFNEREPAHYISEIIKNVSRNYMETEEAIVRRLLDSPVIHADETPINVRGVTQYVWTFTNDKYVVFKLSKTREATIAHEFLATFRGILISDFYTGYDAIPCTHQKCWVHLIRELNDDLWEAPFDTELEMLVGEIRNLIVPIMEAIQQYGLRKRHLLRFMKQVDQFYRKVIDPVDYKSELAAKYQKRFVKYRNSLFVFLQHDEVLWHNNTAERALRHIARQQQVSLVFHEQATHDYLRLLSIRQTLKFQGKSFFKFLFSKERDIDTAR